MNDEELRRAMRPMTKEELEARQLAQARLMRGMTDEELGTRYGDGLRNSHRPTPQECDEQKAAPNR